MSTELALNAQVAPQEYSPITLGLEWPRVGRLLFLVGCSTFGTIMNGFFVASFFVERPLRKVGFVYHACAGFADFIITAVIIPTCSVVLLSGEWDVEPVCHILHFIAIFSTYCYNTFFMMVAMENYCRICRSMEEYRAFTPARVALVAGIIYMICLIAAAVGVYLKYDYDYCKRAHFGNFYFRLATGIFLLVLPFFVTMFCLIAASVHVRRRARKHIQYKRSQLFEYDHSATALNIATYLFFVISWTPYLTIVYVFPDCSNSYYYHCAWLGLSRSVFSTVLYAFLNRNFRHAFAHLFNYCCCKNTLSSSFSGRHRRALEYRTTTGDIRVHIMHQAINSPPRFFCTSRETQEL